MRIIIIGFLIFIGVICCLNILGRKLNKEIVLLNQDLKKRNELLKKTILQIRLELGLTTLKECPEEEKENIVKDVIKFIDDIKGVW